MTLMHSTPLRGKRIAILAADGFEYVELAVPKAALSAAGADIDVISLHRGRIRGMNLTEPTRTVAVDRTIDEVHPGEYDALLLPGGFISPDFMRQSREIREFVAAFNAEGKPIATLCHGPWVLVSAGIVGGRHLSAWPGIRDDITHAGGVWRDEPLVHDRNWVSSRGPQDLAVFVPAMLDLFAYGRLEHVQSASEEDGAALVSSPQFEHPYDLAVKAARILPGPTLRTAAAAAAVTAVGAWAMRRMQA